MDSGSEKQRQAIEQNSISSLLLPGTTSLFSDPATHPTSSTVRDRDVHSQSAADLLSFSFHLTPFLSSSVGSSMSCGRTGAKTALAWGLASPRSDLCFNVGCARGCRGVSAPASVAPSLLLLLHWCLHCHFSFPFVLPPLPVQHFFLVLNMLLQICEHDGFICVRSAGADRNQLCSAQGSLSPLPFLPLSPLLSKPWHEQPMHELVCLQPWL